MKIPKDWREFIELLNSHGVEYLIVGAHALAFHAHPRNTGDLDVFIRRTPENAKRIESVLRAFGFVSLGISAADMEQPDQIVQLGYAPNRIDVITSITGVTFDEAWRERVSGDLDGIPVQFIGREEFVRNKKATGRSKDLADAAEFDD